MAGTQSRRNPPTVWRVGSTTRAHLFPRFRMCPRIPCPLRGSVGLAADRVGDLWRRRGPACLPVAAASARATLPLKERPPHVASAALSGDGNGPTLSAVRRFKSSRPTNQVAPLSSPRTGATPTSADRLASWPQGRGPWGVASAGRQASTRTSSRLASRSARSVVPWWPWWAFPQTSMNSRCSTSSHRTKAEHGYRLERVRHLDLRLGRVARSPYEGAVTGFGPPAERAIR
jgi:hypothetical protein